MSLLPLVGIATVAVAGAGTYFAPQVAKRRLIADLRRRCRARRALVLTYDDGPGPELTPRVLDALARYGAHATFFLLGFRAERAPEVVDRVVAAGHETGCHTHWHRHAFKCGPWDVARDVEQGYRTLAPWVPGDGLFRPPYGKFVLPAWLATRRRGAVAAFWTHDGGDTHPYLPAPEAIAQRVVADGGGVVLLHDFDRENASAASRAEYVVSCTERLLDAARRAGLRVCTFGELMRGAAHG